MKTYFKLLKRAIGVLFVCLFLNSCESEEFNGIDSENESQNFQGEEAYPQKTGKYKEIEYLGKKMIVQIINGQMIHDNDILINEEDYQQSKLTGRSDRRWPNNTVFYAIQSSLVNKSRVTDAIAHWEANTALRFVERTNQPNYINFQTGSGCSSSVGMTGRAQAINLAPGCSTGNTIHEIGHAVGIWHEQSRTDRDDFVRIVTENIRPGTENNFRKVPGAVDYTSDLDFGSIMMYGPKFFSINGQQTIVSLVSSNGNYSIQRRALSADDIAGINIMYPPTNPNPNPNPNPPTPGDRTVSFKGSNDLFVSSENGRNPMNCNRAAANRWEKFTIIDEGDGLVSILGSNGRYVSSENGSKPITCNRTSSGASEKFTLESRGGNKYAIKALSNGRYISSEDGRKEMTCNRSRIGAWEEFTVSEL